MMIPLVLSRIRLEGAKLWLLGLRLWHNNTHWTCLEPAELLAGVLGDQSLAHKKYNYNLGFPGLSLMQVSRKAGSALCRWQKSNIVRFFLSMIFCWFINDIWVIKWQNNIDKIPINVILATRNVILAARGTVKPRLNFYNCKHAPYVNTVYSVFPSRTFD